MKKFGHVFTAFLMVLALWGVSYGATEGMTEAVRSSIDSALKILNDPALEGKDHRTERRDKVRALITKVIDFEEMTKRSLGIHWRDRTDEERGEFVRLFSALLEASYMDQIETNYDAKVFYKGAKINKKHSRGIVRTKVLTRKEKEVPIDYRMMKKGHRWVAYDIVIEGVSLVSNYRTQFSQIIHKSSYEGLVKDLRKKLKTRKPLVLKDHHRG